MFVANIQLKRMHKQNMRPVQIGYDVFESLTEAARRYRISSSTVGKKIKEHRLIEDQPCFYITHEQYLQGGIKDIPSVSPSFSWWNENGVGWTGSIQELAIKAFEAGMKYERAETSGRPTK